MEGILLGMGNPLLDISANTDEDILKKYGLEANNAILADESHMPLYKELEEKYNVDYIAGGATQNTMRVAQWLLKKPKCCVYMGCVGNDEHSKILKEKATSEGVIVKYESNSEHSTGTCAVIVTKNGMCRSLVANLSAANHFSKSHLDIPENRELINRAKIFYISGFFLTVSIESILDIGKHACAANKVFAMNLSAPFLCEFFKDNMIQAFPYIDIIFGNETEAGKFSEVHNFGLKNIGDIALKVAALPKANSARKRTVVFTQGADNVVLAKDGKITEFPVISLTEDKLIDTNGAGDAFVGGFLSQLVQEHSLEACIKCGIWAATQIIQLSGCQCPHHVTYNAS